MKEGEQKQKVLFYSGMWLRRESKEWGWFYWVLKLWTMFTDSFLHLLRIHSLIIPAMWKIKHLSPAKTNKNLVLEDLKPNSSTCEHLRHRSTSQQWKQNWSCSDCTAAKIPSDETTAQDALRISFLSPCNLVLRVKTGKVLTNHELLRTSKAHSGWIMLIHLSLLISFNYA